MIIFIFNACYQLIAADTVENCGTSLNSECEEEKTACATKPLSLTEDYNEIAGLNLAANVCIHRRSTKAVVR